MTVYRTAPKFEMPIISGTKTTTSWYRWFQNTDTGVPPSSEIPVKVTGSPFTYTAPVKGFLIVQGGTVSAISFTRVGTYATGSTSGTFPLSANDMLKITYGALPTVTWIPQ